MGMLKSFEIEDPLDAQDAGAIEVSVTLTTGERRWCYFMTPAALASCGDWIDGTRTRFHRGAAHLIVVAAPLDPEIIEGALCTLDRQGDLIDCTRAFD